jgi:hypothetical protein
MGRSKPKQQSKSPNKRIEENDERDLSMNITPQPATSRKETTEAEQSKTPDTKLYRPMTPAKDIYRDNASIQIHMDKLDQTRIQQGLPVTMFTYTMYSTILSRKQNKAAQIFWTYFGFVRAFPMKLESEVHDELSLLFNRDEVPNVMVMDGAKAQTEGEFRRKLRDACCHIKQT